jgi:hypothetical protein
VCLDRTEATELPVCTAYEPVYHFDRFLGATGASGPKGAMGDKGFSGISPHVFISQRSWTPGQKGAQGNDAGDGEHGKQGEIGSSLGHISSESYHGQDLAEPRVTMASRVTRDGRDSRDFLVRSLYICVCFG